MKVRYKGRMLTAEIYGKVVRRGEIIDLPKAVAEELIARGECEPVKTERRDKQK